jgi:hypothetical protein
MINWKGTHLYVNWKNRKPVWLYTWSYAHQIIERDVFPTNYSKTEATSMKTHERLYHIIYLFVYFLCLISYQAVWISAQYVFYPDLPYSSHTFKTRPYCSFKTDHFFDSSSWVIVPSTALWPICTHCTQYCTVTHMYTLYLVLHCDPYVHIVTSTALWPICTHCT